MKQITFEYEGKDYTLEYTRNSVRTMERRGFVSDDITTKPMTVVPDLFAGAFLSVRHVFILILRQNEGRSAIICAVFYPPQGLVSGAPPPYN